MKWNAISDGLPPMGVPLIVTVKDNLEHGQNKILCPAYYERRRENNGYRFNWRYRDMIYDLLPDVSEVIAWAEFPTPFEEWEEVDRECCREPYETPLKRVNEDLERKFHYDRYEKEIREEVVDELRDRICSHFAGWQYAENDPWARRIIELAIEGVEEISKRVKEGADER